MRASTTQLFSARHLPRLPEVFLRACRNQSLMPSRHALVVTVREQLLCHFEKTSDLRGCSSFPVFQMYPSSTERGHLGRSGFARAAGSGLSRDVQPCPGWCDLEGRAPLNTNFRFRKRYLISTSRFGTGQKSGSNKTPLGLHRVAEKIGGGHPIGTAFRNRQAVGLTWQGLPDAPIAHRILWLEGLEPGFNQGGEIDTHSRYIYFHGIGDETTLGRPASRGCIHVAAGDLIGLFDRVPSGTLVWIQ
jgi:hypothetical protein